MHRFFSKPETLLRLRRGPLGNYLDANLALKEQILAKMGTWDETKTGRYRPENPLLKFLKSL